MIREVAFIKYPALTEEGRWIKLLREYLWPLRDRLKFKKNAPKGIGADMMSKPAVVLLVQRQRKPLMKMFRRYATMASSGAELASKMSAGGAKGGRGLSESYSVTTDQLLSLAEEFEISPQLVDEEKCKELREQTRPSADYGGLDFSGFCEWLCVVACDLYTTGHDDLARNGYEVEYPTVRGRVRGV